MYGNSFMFWRCNIFTFRWHMLLFKFLLKNRLHVGAFKSFNFKEFWCIFSSLLPELRTGKFKQTKRKNNVFRAATFKDKCGLLLLPKTLLMHLHFLLKCSPSYWSSKKSYFFLVAQPLREDGGGWPLRNKNFF